MTEEDIDNGGYRVVSADFTPADGKGPALLDIAYWDDVNKRNKYVTLQGKAAKKFSDLQAGDTYYETPR